MNGDCTSSDPEEHVWVQSLNITLDEHGNSIDDEINAPTDDPILACIEKVKDKLVLAHALNTCPPGRQVVILRRWPGEGDPSLRPSTTEYIYGYHGTTYENLKQIMEDGWILCPHFGAGRNQIYEHYSVNLPLVYAAPLGGTSTAAHKKSITTASHYPSGLHHS